MTFSAGAFSSALKMPEHQPFAECLLHLQGEDLRPVALEQVDGPRRLAEGGEHLLQNLQARHVEVGHAVAGDHVAAGEAHDGGGGLGLRHGEIGEDDVVVVVDPGAVVIVIPLGGGGGACWRGAGNTAAR